MNKTKEIEKLQDKLLNKEVIESLEAFVQNMKVVNNTYRSMKKLSDIIDPSIIRLREIANRINVDFDDIAIIKFPMHPTIITEIWMKLLERTEEIYKNMETVTRQYSAGDVAFKSTKHGAVVSDKTIIIPSIRLFTCLTGEKIAISLLNFLKDRPEMVAYCSKSLLSTSMNELNSALLSENPLKGKMISFSKYDGIKMLKFKSKFNIENIAMDQNLKLECETLERLLDSYNNGGELPFKRNILLSGIPGVGKTTILNGIVEKAIEKKCTIIYVGSVGDITEAYSFAETMAPSIIILEDFDLMAKNRTSYSNLDIDLLNIMDGAKEAKGVLTFATTNRIEDIDEAAIRAGRINRYYDIGYPTLQMKQEILNLHLRYYKIDEEVIKDVKHEINEFIKRDAITGAMIDSLTLAFKQSKDVNKNNIGWILNGLVYDKKDITDSIL
uniref:Putative ATPase domain containing protein n=1 Tax=viral metagenome TaxID=1070528 RepID=A0A6M3L4P2_9ZZZZ